MEGTSCGVAAGFALHPRSVKPYQVGGVELALVDGSGHFYYGGRGPLRISKDVGNRGRLP